MNAFGWVLVAVVIVCLIILIRKSGNTEKEVGRGASEIIKTDLEPAPNHDDNPPQVTIYQYHGTGRVQLCPVCDGENDVSASCCSICGQKLK